MFQASIGFYDTVVAVPSQAAALRAWGTRQNLFADKVARPCDDEKAVEAALARPGQVLRRPVGTKDTFSLEPHLPSVPKSPDRRGKAAAPSKKPPRKPDRTALDKAEAALAGLEEEHRERIRDLAERRRALDEEEGRAKRLFDEKRQRARQAIARARKAYEEAGG